MERVKGIEPSQSAWKAGALPLSYTRMLNTLNFYWSGRRDSNPRPSPWQGDALPLSHFRDFGDLTTKLLYDFILHLEPYFFWWRELDSNQRRRCQQIYSLPPLATRESLRIKMAIRKGLEPSTSSVTGWHSNQLNYRTAY